MIPEPSLRRLPSYLHYLQTLLQRGRTVVSTSHMADHFRQDPTQVRKDLAHTGVHGRTGRGYDVAELVTAITHFLGWDNITDAFLVGTGHLGRALLGYDRLSRYGINIVAAFDVDPEVVGRQVHDIPVFSIEKLGELAKRMRVHIGVIATPADVAQSVADTMIANGVLGLLNFAPRTLIHPEGVAVENVDLYASVGLITSHLEHTIPHLEE